MKQKLRLTLSWVGEENLPTKPEVLELILHAGRLSPTVLQQLILHQFYNTTVDNCHLQTRKSNFETSQEWL